MGKGMNKAKQSTGRKIGKWHDRTKHLPSTVRDFTNAEADVVDPSALAYGRNHKPYGVGRKESGIQGGDNQGDNGNGG